MSNGRKKIEGCLIAVILLFSLSGCVAPVIPFLVGADVAQHYAGKVKLNGAEIGRNADWENRYDKQVNYTMPGMHKGTWTCARRSGAELCVPADQAVKSNISPSVVFDCYNGRGGIFTNAATGDIQTLYCMRI